MDPQELVHRTFFMTAELMHRVEDYRKTRSIPTSVAKANVLFDKNDLAVANFQKIINRLGGSSKGGFRYGKGKGKGKGGKSYGDTKNMVVDTVVTKEDTRPVAMVVESPIKSDSQVGVRPHQHPVVPEDLTNRLRVRKSAFPLLWDIL